MLILLIVLLALIVLVALMVGGWAGGAGPSVVRRTVVRRRLARLDPAPRQRPQPDRRRPPAPHEQQPAGLIPNDRPGAFDRRRFLMIRRRGHL